MFDIAAVASEPAVESIDPKSRRLSLRLLREALESRPGSLHLILREVLDLPEEQVYELRELLDKTSLSSVIAATRQITDRLDFLLGLEELVFGESRKNILERRQLHRILAGETWVFREEYALTADDVTLRTARWEFWIVGDRLDPSTDLLLRQRDREPGVFVVPGEHNVTVRAVTWAQVLQDARHRLGFVRDSLPTAARATSPWPTSDAQPSCLRFLR